MKGMKFKMMHGYVSFYYFRRGRRGGRGRRGRRDYSGFRPAEALTLLRTAEALTGFSLGLERPEPPLGFERLPVKARQELSVTVVTERSEDPRRSKIHTGVDWLPRGARSVPQEASSSGRLSGLHRHYTLKWFHRSQTQSSQALRSRRLYRR